MFNLNIFKRKPTLTSNLNNILYNITNGEINTYEIIYTTHKGKTVLHLPHKDIHNVIDEILYITKELSSTNMIIKPIFIDTTLVDFYSTDGYVNNEPNSITIELLELLIGLVEFYSENRTTSIHSNSIRPYITLAHTLVDIFNNKGVK